MSKRIHFTAMIAVLLLLFGGTAFYEFPGIPLTGIKAYADDIEQIPVKVLIVPKFEIGKIEGDFPGEAQLFYDLVTTACDLELGHHTSKEELTDPENGLTWFPDEDSFNNYDCKPLNSELYEKAYQLIKDCPLRTTEKTKKVIEENFPDEVWANREPQVLRGTAVSADSYWKGMEDHTNAVAAAEYYECSDSYAVTEMEEIAIMNAAECFDLLSHVISLRVVVNLDTFLKGESPEQLWLDNSDYASQVSEENTETLDIFEPGMENLFDTGKIVIDAILEGELVQGEIMKTRRRI